MKKTKRYNEQQPISEVLKAFVFENNLEKGINQVEIETLWKQIMGPAISKYTQQIKLQKNTLYVKLTSSVLREELSYGLTQIAKNINNELGQELITKIILR